MIDICAVETVSGEPSACATFYQWTGVPGAGDPLFVSSVADLISQVLVRVGSLPNGGKESIRRLFIGGHGSPGEQSVGSGERSDPTGRKVLKGTAVGLAGDAARLLPALAGLFSSTAVVTLGGADVADGAKGALLLKAVSAALGGVDVQGSDSSQATLIPGMIGAVRRCSKGLIIQIANGLWSISVPALPLEAVKTG